MRFSKSLGVFNIFVLIRGAHIPSVYLHVCMTYDASKKTLCIFFSRHFSFIVSMARLWADICAVPYRVDQVSQLRLIGISFYHDQHGICTTLIIRYFPAVE